MSTIDQIKTLPRTAVDISLQAARLPLTAAEAVLRRGQQSEDWPPTLLFEGAEAAVRVTVGGWLRDETLQEQGRLAQAKVAQLRKAAELSAEADRQRQAADAALKQKLETERQQRQRVEQQAEQRKAELERQKQQEKARVQQQAAAAKEQARKVEAAVDASLTKQERAAKRAKLSADSQALGAEREALRAQGQLVDLDAELQAAKSGANGAGL